MSPIDPRQLRGAKRAFVDVITKDRLCGKCRYNLKGLPANGKCPECGQPIGGRGRGFRRFSDNLTDAPMFYLKTLAIGTWILAGSGIGSSICFFYADYTWRFEWALAAGAASILWWMGVFIVTAPRAFGENTQRDELLDGPWLRAINRFVHSAWIIAAGCWIVAAQARPPIDDYCRLAANIFQVGGILGYVALALQMAALADWARDTSLAERFKVTAWAMAASGIVAIAGAISVGLGLKGALIGILVMGMNLALVIMSLAKIVFIYALFQLAHIAFWAVSNNAAAASTERRLLTRRDGRDQEMADRSAVAIALQDAAPPPELGSDAPAQTAFESNIIDRPSGGADPYGLEPDIPPRDTSS